MTCCNGFLVKTSAFIAALFSIAVLMFSSIVLISSVTYDKHQNSTAPANVNNTRLKPLRLNQPENGTLDFNISTTTTSTPGTIIFSRDESEDNMTGTTTTSSIPPHNTISPHDKGNEPESKSTPSREPESWNFFQNHDFWKGKSDTYIILMQASSGTGVFAAFLQLGFSWLLICGANKDLKDRTKLWNLSNFIVLILLVVIILVPLSYNTSNNDFEGSYTFFRNKIVKRIKSIEFSPKTLHTIQSSFPNFLVKNLTLYYYVLGVDAWILLVFLIPPLLCSICYPCKKCCCKRKQEKSDSDLMLFRDSGDSF